MIITIAGDPGSGKSTVAKILAGKLDMDYFSTGELFRKIAEDMNMPLLELTKKAEQNPHYDKVIDEYQQKLGREEDNFILEGRLGFYFIPKSVKICLKVSSAEAARRIYSDKRKGENNSSIEDTLRNIIIREKSEKKRFRKLYGVDIDDESNYDFVINTTNISAKRVVEKIMNFLKKNDLV